MSAAYDVVGTKGGIVPSAKTTSNLSAAIDSIPTGGGKTVAIRGFQGDGSSNFSVFVDGTLRPYNNIYNFQDSIDLDALGQNGYWAAYYPDGTSQSGNFDSGSGYRFVLMPT